ncbi:uncharacterized [Tachysurus ichikawai]
MSSYYCSFLDSEFVGLQVTELIRACLAILVINVFITVLPLIHFPPHLQPYCHTALSLSLLFIIFSVSPILRFMDHRKHRRGITSLKSVIPPMMPRCSQSLVTHLNGEN